MKKGVSLPPTSPNFPKLLHSGRGCVEGTGGEEGAALVLSYFDGGAEVGEGRRTVVEEFENLPDDGGAFIGGFRIGAETVSLGQRLEDGGLIAGKIGMQTAQRGQGYAFRGGENHDGGKIGLFEKLAVEMRADQPQMGFIACGNIEHTAGFLGPELGEDAPEDYIVHGPNRITALPMEVPVCYQEVAHCMEKSIARIETAVLSALEHTPPELYADIVHNGIYLTGGGALLRGLDRRLTDKINIPFHIAEDPLHSVAKGTGIALKNVNNFSFLM